MTTWTPITCTEREELLAAHRGRPGFGVLASKTDLDGEFGEPEVYTRWGYHESGEDQPVFQESRWPSPTSGEPDVKPCEHYRGGE